MGVREWAHRSVPPTIGMAGPTGLEPQFASDAFTDDPRFRALTVVYYTRDCLALVVDTSPSGRRLVCELDAIIARRGRRLSVFSDNGRVHQDDDPALASGFGKSIATISLRQADAERLRRKRQRQLPR